MPCAGVITTLVAPPEVAAMQQLAVELEIKLQQIEQPAPALTTAQDLEMGTADITTAKQGLEDMYNLF